MPQYHFDFQDDDAFIKDEEGMELPDIDSAQLEAARSLADMVKGAQDGDRIPAGHPMSIEVRDAGGPLFSLRFSFRFGESIELRQACLRIFNQPGVRRAFRCHR